MRRWRGLRLRRGQFWGGYASSPVPPAVPPRIIRQAGSSPRWAARLLPSRRRRYDPAWPQANQGQAYPSFTDPAGSRPRWHARLTVSRGRRWDPPWFPPPPVPPPQVYRPAGPLRFAARLLPSARRRWDPPWGQGNQGQAWPSFTRQPLTAEKRGTRLLLSRGRRWDPPWPQANQGAPWPSFTRQAGTRTRFTTRQSRGRFTAFPFPVPPPRVVNCWSATFAQPSSFGTIPPALQSVVVALTPANSACGGSGYASAGNWLFAIVGLNESSASAQFTVGDADDQHSFWRPGDVTASNWAVSPAAGLTRTSVWYTPNIIRQVNDVYIAPSGCLDAISVLVIEVANLGPWDTVTGIFTNYAAAATSLNLALGAPSAQAFLVAAVTGDNDTAGQAFAPAGWSTLPAVTATNGTDHTCDCVLTAATITTTGSISVNGTASSAEDLSGVVIGVLTQAPTPIPANANPAFPGRTILEAAFGSGYETPPDQMTWTTLSDSTWPGPWSGTSTQFKRFWGWQDRTGIPWGLGQYQSSSGSIALDSADGALSPSNVGSPFYSNALNPGMSFQSGTAGWSAWNNSALASAASPVFASAAQGLPQSSLKVTPDGVTASPGAAGTTITVLPSTVYTVSAWFYSPAGWNGGQVGFAWYTGGGAFISFSSSSVVNLPAGTWTQVTVTATSPANAGQAFMFAQQSGTPSAGQVFYLAEAAIAAGSSPVATGLVTAGTPVRLRMALGTVSTEAGAVAYNRWYTWFRNAQSWPEKRNKVLRNYVEATTTDVWQSASGSCPTPYRAEVQQDLQAAGTGSGWWWPCDDQPLAGGVLPTTLRNAATGTSAALTIEASPNGVSSQDLYSSSYGGAGGAAGTDLTLLENTANPAVAVYNVAQQAGWMYGDPQVSPQSAQTGNPVTAQPGSAAWQQTGAQGNTGSHGWFLAATDTFPPIANGVTVSGWFNYGFGGSAASINHIGTYYNVAGQPWCQLTLLELATASAPVAILYLDTSGHLILETFNGATGTNHTIYTGSDLRCSTFFRVTLELTQTSYTVYLNGGLSASVTGSATISASAWNWLIVNGDLGSSGGSSLSAIQHGGNVSVSHVKVFAGLLRQYRELAQYSAAITGCGLLPAPTSVQVAAVVNQNPTGFTPDGSEYQGSYGSGGSPFTVSAVAAAVAGSYTSGPSARSAIGGQGFASPSSFGASFFVSWNTLAPLVQVFTAASAAAETEASACLGSGDSYSSGYGATASGHGASHVSAGTGASPPTAPSALGDTVRQRLERILGYGGITVPMRAVDPASLLVQAALDVGGQQTGASVTNIVSSDSGWWFADLCGVLNYRQRSHLNADTVIWQIGMNTAAGQIPFDGSIEYDNDPQRVFTVITVQPYSPDGASLAEVVPANFTAVNAAQQQYGPRPLGINSYLQDGEEQQDQADWAFTYYGTLRKRIKSLTIDAARHPAAWGLVVALNLGDLISVSDSPMGAPASTVTYRVSSASRQLACGANGLPTAGQIQIAADPVSVLWT